MVWSATVTVAEIYLFADDTEISEHIKSGSDSAFLQLNNLVWWSSNWLVELNTLDHIQE